MLLQHPRRSRLLAHHLYDLATCEHKIALDARLDRSLRTPPDEALTLLLERGNRLEREIADTLGWPEIEVEDGDFRAAADRTHALMAAGVPGIYQGVLLDDSRLARPDLLQRIEGASGLGNWTYVPGDIKSALTPRTDAVLQVGFAALLLEKTIEAHVGRGFVVLGNGTWEEIDLDSVRCSIEDAVDRVSAIQNGHETTRASYSSACPRCAWRGTCLPELQNARDASFVDGLTRTLHRVLARHGVCTLDDLAVVDVDALRRAGAPTDGLDRLRRQAQALLKGAPVGKRHVEMPNGTQREHFLHIETDPMDNGAPFLLAWAGSTPDANALEPARVTVAATTSERAAAFSELLGQLDANGISDPIYVWGHATVLAFDALAEAVGTAPVRLGDAEGRFVDLAPAVRRAAALPVWRYRFAEVAAFVRGTPRPGPDEPDDALFVEFARLQAGDAAAPGRLERAGCEAIASLHAIRWWLR